MNIIKYAQFKERKIFVFTLLLCCLLLSLLFSFAACDKQIVEPVAEQEANHSPDCLVESDVAPAPSYVQNEDLTQDYLPENYSIELEPILVPLPMSHRAIAAGNFRSLVITDGRLWAWGYNESGQLGDGTTENKTIPVQIGTDTDWVSVCVGISHTVALKVDGSLWTWGCNMHGALGDGTTEIRAYPVQIGGTDWAYVVAGDAHTMAIKSDGTLWGWGWNSFGQVGDGMVIERGDYRVLEPVQIGTYTDWVRVMPGRIRTMALRADGSLWFWGSDQYLYIGNGPPRISSSIPFRQIYSTPMQIGTYEDWIRMMPPSIRGTDFEIRKDGSLWAWGINSNGQLGDGTTIDRDAPVQIGTDMDWVDIALGDNRTVAIKADGSVWSWGWVGPVNHDVDVVEVFSLIGDGGDEDRHYPVMIIGSRYQ